MPKTPEYVKDVKRLLNDIDTNKLGRTGIGRNLLDDVSNVESKEWAKSRRTSASLIETLEKEPHHLPTGLSSGEKIHQTLPSSVYNYQSSSALSAATQKRSSSASRGAYDLTRSKVPTYSHGEQLRNALDKYRRKSDMTWLMEHPSARTLDVEKLDDITAKLKKEVLAKHTGSSSSSSKRGSSSHRLPPPSRDYPEESSEKSKNGKPMAHEDPLSASSFSNQVWQELNARLNSNKITSEFNRSAARQNSSSGALDRALGTRGLATRDLPESQIQADSRATSDGIAPLDSGRSGSRSRGDVTCGGHRVGLDPDLNLKALKHITEQHRLSSDAHTFGSSAGGYIAKQCCSGGGRYDDNRGGGGHDSPLLYDPQDVLVGVADQPGQPPANSKSHWVCHSFESSSKTSAGYEAPPPELNARGLRTLLAAEENIETDRGSDGNILGSRSRNGRTTKVSSFSRSHVSYRMGREPLLAEDGLAEDSAEGEDRWAGSSRSLNNNPNSDVGGVVGGDGLSSRMGGVFRTDRSALKEAPSAGVARDRMAWEEDRETAARLDALEARSRSAASARYGDNVPLDTWTESGDRRRAGAAGPSFSSSTAKEGLINVPTSRAKSWSKGRSSDVGTSGYADGYASVVLASSVRVGSSHAGTYDEGMGEALTERPRKGTGSRSDITSVSPSSSAANSKPQGFADLPRGERNLAESGIRNGVGRITSGFDLDPAETHSSFGLSLHPVSSRASCVSDRRGSVHLSSGPYMDLDAESDPQSELGLRLSRDVRLEGKGAGPADAWDEIGNNHCSSSTISYRGREAKGQRLGEEAGAPRRRREVDVGPSTASFASCGSRDDSAMGQDKERDYDQQQIVKHPQQYPQQYPQQHRQAEEYRIHGDVSISHGRVSLHHLQHNPGDSDESREADSGRHHRHPLKGGALRAAEHEEEDRMYIATASPRSPRIASRSSRAYGIADRLEDLGGAGPGQSPAPSSTPPTASYGYNINEGLTRSTFEASQSPSYFLRSSPSASLATSAAPANSSAPPPNSPLRNPSSRPPLPLRPLYVTAKEDTVTSHLSPRAMASTSNGKEGNRSPYDQSGANPRSRGSTNVTRSSYDGVMHSHGYDSRSRPDPSYDIQDLVASSVSDREGTCSASSASANGFGGGRSSIDSFSAHRVLSLPSSAAPRDSLPKFLEAGRAGADANVRSSSYAQSTYDGGGSDSQSSRLLAGKASPSPSTAARLEMARPWRGSSDVPALAGQDEIERQQTDFDLLLRRDQDLHLDPFHTNFSDPPPAIHSSGGRTTVKLGMGKASSSPSGSFADPSKSGSRHASAFRQIRASGDERDVLSNSADQRSRQDHSMGGSPRGVSNGDPERGTLIGNSFTRSSNPYEAGDVTSHPDPHPHHRLDGRSPCHADFQEYRFRDFRSAEALTDGNKSIKPLSLEAVLRESRRDGGSSSEEVISSSTVAGAGRAAVRQSRDLGSSKYRDAGALRKGAEEMDEARRHLSSSPRHRNSRLNLDDGDDSHYNSREDRSAFDEEERASVSSQLRLLEGRGVPGTRSPPLRQRSDDLSHEIMPRPSPSASRRSKPTSASIIAAAAAATAAASSSFIFTPRNQWSDKYMFDYKSERQREAITTADDSSSLVALEEDVELLPFEGKGRVREGVSASSSHSAALRSWQSSSSLNVSEKGCKVVSKTDTTRAGQDRAKAEQEKVFLRQRQRELQELLRGRREREVKKLESAEAEEEAETRRGSGTLRIEDAPYSSRERKGDVLSPAPPGKRGLLEAERLEKDEQLRVRGTDASVNSQVSRSGAVKEALLLPARGFERQETSWRGPNPSLALDDERDVRVSSNKTEFQPRLCTAYDGFGESKYPGAILRDREETNPSTAAAAPAAVVSAADSSAAVARSSVSPSYDSSSSAAATLATSMAGSRQHVSSSSSSSSDSSSSLLFSHPALARRGAGLEPHGRKPSSSGARGSLLDPGSKSYLGADRVRSKLSALEAHFEGLRDLEVRPLLRFLDPESTDNGIKEKGKEGASLEGGRGSGMAKFEKGGDEEEGKKQLRRGLATSLGGSDGATAAGGDDGCIDGDPYVSGCVSGGKKAAMLKAAACVEELTRVLLALDELVDLHPGDRAVRKALVGDVIRMQGRLEDAQRKQASSNGLVGSGQELEGLRRELQTVEAQVAAHRRERCALDERLQSMVSRLNGLATATTAAAATPARATGGGALPSPSSAFSRGAPPEESLVRRSLSLASLHPDVLMGDADGVLGYWRNALKSSSDVEGPKKKSSSVQEQRRALVKKAIQLQGLLT